MSILFLDNISLWFEMGNEIVLVGKAVSQAGKKLPLTLLLVLIKGELKGEFIGEFYGITCKC